MFIHNSGLGKEPPSRNVQRSFPQASPSEAPRPDYRQAGTPLGRDRHGGASSRFAHDENWIEDAKLSGTRGQARRCASQIIQTSQAIKNFVSNGIKLAQETTQKEMLINRDHVKEFRENE
jgi:hypothetical protein